jgi:hypothetical protein
VATTSQLSRHNGGPLYGSQTDHVASGRIPRASRDPVLPLQVAAVRAAGMTCGSVRMRATVCHGKLRDADVVSLRARTSDEQMATHGHPRPAALLSTTT